MNEEAFIQGFVKAAYEGASRLELHNFAPVTRRQLDSEEEAEIGKAQKKIIPKVFTSSADPLTADMSSPSWASGLGATLGAGVGGLLGNLAGGVVDHEGAGTALGALLGGGIGGVVGYKGRTATNNSIAEAMRKLPRGATRDDYNRDPLVQAEREQAIKRLLAVGGRVPYPYPA